MSDEPQAANQGANSAKSASEVQVPEPLSGPTQQPATEQHLEKVEREMNAFERSTLRWTKATFFILGVTGLFISLQWCVMRGQLHEMQTGGVDTHNLAEAARIDQRAWVTMGRFELTEEPIVGGKSIKVRFSIISNGKTPAVKCTTERMPLMGAPGGIPQYYANHRDIWPDGPKTTGRPVFVVLPIAEQDETEPWTTDPRSTLTPKVIREYTEKTTVLYVIAKIWYDDVFGDHHWTTTCRWHEFKTPPTEFWPCVGGAEMDTPYQSKKAN
jgi:hypothetical protein